MKIRQTLGDECIVLHIEGVFDAQSLYRYGQSLQPGGRPPNLVVDLSRVTFIDSSGAGQLLDWHRKALCCGHHFGLTGARGQPRMVLDAFYPELAVA